MVKVVMTTPRRATLVTRRQAEVHDLFVRHRSMSVVARLLGISQVSVREKLVQYERNLLRDRGVRPPPLKTMLRGDVSPRFDVSRAEAGGRPAKHRRVDPGLHPPVVALSEDNDDQGVVTVPTGATRRVIVAAVRAGLPVHQGFWTNLRAFADSVQAELVVFALGHGRRSAGLGAEFKPYLEDRPLVVTDQLLVAADAAISRQSTRPLPICGAHDAPVWTIVPAEAVQFETIARLRVDGLRVQMTTGAITVDATTATDVAAVLIEVAADGVVHCRHICASADGDGSFQDLDRLVSGGAVVVGRRIEALTYGDLHCEHMDPDVSRATWGIGSTGGNLCLLDRLRPRIQIFHDVCDFAARNPFVERDHHRRFAQLWNGGGDVRAGMGETARFLAATRRSWCRSLVVASNHDDMLLRWLMEADFRDDPTNAIYYLELSLDLHRRLRDGGGRAGFFERSLRRLVPDGLEGIKFAADGSSIRIAGTEVAMHGHKGPDGRAGGMRGLERLGLRATIGHTHRPTTRGGLVSVGVCQTERDYAAGPLTSWAVGHVATYASGARQHLIFHGGRFHA